MGNLKKSGYFCHNRKSHRTADQAIRGIEQESRRAH